MQQQLPQPMQAYAPNLDQNQLQAQRLPLMNQQQQPQQLSQGIDNPDTMLNHVFSQPTFEPTDLMPFLNLKNVDTSTTGTGSSNLMAGGGPGVGNSNNGGNVAGDVDMGGPASVFGTFSGADMPRQDPSLGAFVSGNIATSQGQEQGQVQADGTPLVNAMVKDYAPPWLWTGDDTSNLNLAAQYSSVLADDTDMKMDEMDEMDENFDWQDFGQTLGGMSNGVWSSHGL